MAVLITGGTGFVGQYLARKLVMEGEKKVVLFDLFPNPRVADDIADNVEIVRGDFSEPGELMAVIKKYDISHIFHLAYLLHDLESFPTARAIRTNCVGTTHLFEMAKVAGVKRVIWASSVVVYGYITSSEKMEFLDENVPLKPRSIYGACKVFNENIAEIMAEKYGFDHICLRLESVYGLGRAQRRGASYDIYSIIEQVAEGKPATLPPLNHQLTWSYVKDAAGAFYAAYMAGKTQSRIFNFAGENRTVEDTVKVVRRLFPRAEINISPKGMNIVPYLSTERMRKEIQFKPQYSLENGMKEYADSLARVKGI